MNLMDSLNRLAKIEVKSFKPRPSIDDWIDAGPRRAVEFGPSSGLALVGESVVNVGRFKCQLTGHAGAAFFVVNGYGDTSGDAFVDALRQLSDSGVPA